MRPIRVFKTIGYLAILQATALGLIPAAIAQSFPVQYANALQRANYSVYTGDVNGDGAIDVLLVPKKIFVIINYDVPFPVPAKPASPTFVLLSGGGTYTLTANPSASILNSSVWTPGNYDISFGDTTGGGSVSMLLQPLRTGNPSFLVDTSSSTGQPILLENLAAATIGVDLSASGTVISLQDINWDGRADLVVYQNGMLSTALTAATNGTFSAPQTSDGGAPLTAWRAFCAALRLGDAASASNLLSSIVQPQIGPLLTTLGSGQIITTITQNWTEPLVVTVQPDYATFAVSQTENGSVKLHLVTLIFENGRWVVENL